MRDQKISAIELKSVGQRLGTRKLEDPNGLKKMVYHAWKCIG